jgi:hypothetical protein
VVALPLHRISFRVTAIELIYVSTSGIALGRAGSPSA